MAAAAGARAARRKSLLRATRAAARAPPAAAQDETPAPASRKAAARVELEEVVEGGFRFKRRKRVAEAEPEEAAPAPAQQKAAPPQQRRKQAAAPAPRAQAAPAVAYPSGVGAGVAFHDGLAEDDPEPERLKALCADVCDVEAAAVRRALGEGPLADAVEGALQEFELQVEQLVVDGKVRAGAAPAAEPVSAPSDALLRRKAALREVRDRLSGEEAQWAALAERAPEAATADAAAAAATGGHSMAAAAEAATERVRAGAVTGQVGAACDAAHARLAVQAEGLASLVQGSELLCERAEATCAALAHALRTSDFRALPAVNSPERLISTLVAAAPAKP